MHWEKMLETNLADGYFGGIEGVAYNFRDMRETFNFVYYGMFCGI